MKLENICLRRHGATLLDHVSADMAPGLIGIIGPNGAGKTSLLQAIAGIHPATGRCIHDGRDIMALPRAQRARIIGYLPQAAAPAWDVTVMELMELGLPSGIRPERAQLRAALKSCGADGWAGRTYRSLSGGQKQRAMLARAMAHHPSLLLLDEPCAGLDPAAQLEIMALLAARVKEGLTIAVICHDLALASRFCGSLLLMDGGKAAAWGEAPKLLTDERLSTHFSITARRVKYQGRTCVIPMDSVS